MENTDFSVLIKAIIDTSDIGKDDIDKVQKVVEKYHLNLTADLDTNETLNKVKKIIPLLEEELSKITGIDIKIDDNDILKAIKQVSNDTAKATREQEKLTNAMAKGREQAEKLRQTEEKRQQIAQDKATNKALEEEYALKQKLATQANSIKGNLSGGDNSSYSTQIAQLQSQFQKLGLSEDEVKTKMLEVNAAYKSLASGGTDKQIISNNEKFKNSLKSTQNEAKNLKTQISQIYNPGKQTNLGTSIQNWLSKNTRATKEAKEEVRKYYAELNEGRVSVGRLQEIESSFKNIDAQMRAKGKLGFSYGDQIKNAANSFTQWIGVSGAIMGTINTVRKMVDEVMILDDSLLELSKVSDLSAEGLAKVTNEAYNLGEKVGKTGTQVIDAVTNFKRAGYDLKDSMDFAEDALVMTNVAEGIDDASESATALISIMKGFNDSSKEFSEKILNSINEVDILAS